MMSKKPSWQRARSPEQIETRRQSILSAAGRLLESGGMEQTGLNAIAREAGLAKANLYRYFESREAILLQLLMDEVVAWSDALCKQLRKLEGSGDFDAIAKAFAKSISNRPRFCLLLGALATVLEHNVDEETVVEFKRGFLAAVTPSVDALDAAIPALSSEEAFSALAMLVMAASGAWPHCNPAPVVEEVIKRPEFASIAIRFEPLMQAYASTILRGMLAE